MKIVLSTVRILYENDVVLSRQRARQIAEALGFDRQDQVRIATTISELARNVFQYAKKGKIEFSCDDTSGAFQAVVVDKGPGIAHLEEVLGGEYSSPTGMGLGIVGAKKLMDSFQVETAPGKGTKIVIGKSLAPPRLFSAKQIASIISRFVNAAPEDPFQEVQRQNQELLGTMAELERRQEELDQLNKELEDTNRGVVALYAELDEKADYLRRASEIKTRFLSNMTHEFRTPLNSILGLSRMLLDRTDGELTVDQEKQISFIRRAATDLSELVNDLLDLSKVEAGKISIRPAEFEIKDMFGALRGMLGPLLAHNNSINLFFDDPVEVPPLFTDESKLSQILRNFISNALKFTEKGEVRVSAHYRSDKVIVIDVRDTGIGIAPEDIARIFEEFTQIESPLQKRTKGTGLGLPLSKKLAEVLGGSVTVESRPGIGSTFSVILPLAYRGETEISYISEIVRQIDRSRAPVLIVDDNTETLFIYETYLKGSHFQALPVRSLQQAREVLKTIRPLAIILDILLEHENSWGFLTDLKREKETRDIPVYVVTMVENERKARSAGADDFHLKPVDREWLLRKLSGLNTAPFSKKLLVIDDDEVSRYLFRGLVAGTPVRVLEAAGGHEGLRLALAERPDALFLDLDIPDMNGFTVLNQLKARLGEEKLPVIFYTSNVSATELAKGFDSVVGVLSKDFSSREASMNQLLELLKKADHYRGSTT